MAVQDNSIADATLIDWYSAVLESIDSGTIIPTSLAYCDAGASRFYDIYSRGAGKRPHDRALSQAYWQFLRDGLGFQSDRIRLIGLGCGNAWREKSVLQEMREGTPTVEFVGIDSSESMLKAAQQTLSNESAENVLICADFTEPLFRESLPYVHIDHDNITTVFALLGGTAGCFSSESLGQLLRAIVHPGEFVWLEVAARSTNDTIALQERYQDHCDLSGFTLSSLFFYPLERCGFHAAEFDISLDTQTDEYYGALTFEFGVRPKRTLVRGPIKLLPENSVRLGVVRVFILAELRKYLEGEGFRVLACQESTGAGQVLCLRH